MITFSVCGHENVRSLHLTTLEFTKDSELTIRGDCILGVKADFVFEEIKELIRKHDMLKICISLGSKKTELRCKVNKDFNNPNEMVIRKSEFICQRTLGILSDKAAIDIDRAIVGGLRQPDATAKVTMEGI